MEGILILQRDRKAWLCSITESPPNDMHAAVVAAATGRYDTSDAVRQPRVISIAPNAKASNACAASLGNRLYTALSSPVNARASTSIFPSTTYPPTASIASVEERILSLSALSVSSANTAARFSD